MLVGPAGPAAGLELFAAPVDAVDPLGSDRATVDAEVDPTEPPESVGAGDAAAPVTVGADDPDVVGELECEAARCAGRVV